jgi:hypothetical protein
MGMTDENSNGAEPIAPHALGQPEPLRPATERAAGAVPVRREGDETAAGHDENAAAHEVETDAAHPAPFVADPPQNPAAAAAKPEPLVTAAPPAATDAAPAEPTELARDTDATSGETVAGEHPPIVMASTTYTRDVPDEPADSVPAVEPTVVEPAAEAPHADEPSPTGEPTSASFAEPTSASFAEPAQAEPARTESAAAQSPAAEPAREDAIVEQERRPDDAIAPSGADLSASASPPASAGLTPPPLVEPAPEPDMPTRSLTAAELSTGAALARGAAAHPTQAAATVAEPVGATAEPADAERTDTAAAPITETPPRPAASAASANVATGLPSVPGAEMYDDVDTDDEERAPQRPRKKGNRALGFLIAILGTIVFAAAWAGAAYLILLYLGQTAAYVPFLSGVVFLAPIAIYFVSTLIVNLLANRAGWWAHVLGSLLVGALVYFGMIGMYTFLDVGGRPEPVGSLDRLLAFVPNVYFVVAGLVAREVALWSGLILASRGRRLKAQNAEARAEYDRALQRHDDNFA